ncbi:hypothetical protein PIB30_111181, partial [Stylosanthes scabra]|nr:hypothetical protein [Stylosanthes scabra]
SLPVGLGKKSNIKCRWIIDHSDAEVGAFLDSLLGDMEKQSRFDRSNCSGCFCWGFRFFPSDSGPPSLSSAAKSKKKRQKRKRHESFPENAVLGDDTSWEHEVSPLDRAFPADFNYWAALDSRMTQSSVWKALEPMPPEQLLGTAHRYACKLTACLQVGLESAICKP